MKRSSQVALLLMGVAGVGASAYAMMPNRQECKPPQSAVAPGSAVAPLPGAQGAAQAPKDECQQRRRSWWPGSGGYSSSSSARGSRSYFSGSGSSSVSRSGISSSSSTSRSSTPSSTFSRGGFGSTGSSFSVSS